MGNLAFMVKKEPANLSYKTQLATCYEQNGEKAKLLELDKQIIVQSPTNVESRFRLAQDADARNDMDAALILYRELSVLQPKNPDVFYRLYEILRKKNNLDDAALNIGRYIEIKPTAEARAGLRRRSVPAQGFRQGAHRLSRGDQAQPFHQGIPQTICGNRDCQGAAGRSHYRAVRRRGSAARPMSGLTRRSA